MFKPHARPRCNTAGYLDWDMPHKREHYEAEDMLNRSIDEALDSKFPYIPPAEMMARCSCGEDQLEEVEALIKEEKAALGSRLREAFKRELFGRIVKYFEGKRNHTLGKGKHREMVNTANGILARVVPLKPLERELNGRVVLLGVELEQPLRI